MTITIFGIHPVLEAIKKRPLAFYNIFLSRQTREGHLEHILSLAEKSNVKITYETTKSLCRLAHSEQHQGIVAEVDSFPLLDLKTLIAINKKNKKKRFFLILDSIHDPHNLGSLIRSALCSGVGGIVFPKDRAAGLTGTVAKSSAGAIEHVPLCRVVNIASALKSLKEAGIWIVGTSMDSIKSVYEFDFDLDTALVIGGEGRGIRPSIMKKCDYCLSIPIKGPLNSLNASVAGAVVMFEIMRQQQFGSNT